MGHKQTHCSHKHSVDRDDIKQVVLDGGQLHGARLEVAGAVFDGVLDPVSGLFHRRHGHHAVTGDRRITLRGFLVPVRI